MAPILLLLFLVSGATADSDPVQDFCVPDPGPNPVQLTHLSTYPCKNPSNASADDFVFSGIRFPGNFSNQTGFAGISVNPTQFPGLNTLGMSFARADFEQGGVNPPHYHPRATETALVLTGRVYSGFVDSAGRIYAKVLEKGEVMVFPRGLVHFQMNVGESRATIFGSFNSQNPGLVRIPGTVFGSGIKDAVLEKAFGLSPEELEKLEKRFRPS
ncbi:germin-like protein 2-4 [Typha angustifolia]|uniref:germin-like protein 2-4 n=1 Tax=Typha angustifolia TaxID=59011 RepID=UPI003C2FF5E3